ncbi:hypothetical protein AB5I39_10475 [Sphingomonas sp. MMS24-J45]|uniref:hypothetical protein n=1 Tax=Sphingomonas sp. MMS24-J45 TaxID=3238806 RepID=UPI00384DDFF1
MRMLLAALAFTAFAAPGMARDRQAIPPAAEVGKPESCIQLRQIRETRVHGDRTIDFIMQGRKVYRNTLPNACPGLGFEERFTYETSLSQLCSVDIITVLYSTPALQRGASCGLGAFQPVTLAK